MSSPNTAVVNLTTGLLHTATAESAQRSHPWKANLALLLGLAALVIYGLMAQRYFHLTDLAPDLTRLDLNDSWLAAIIDDAIWLGLGALAVPPLTVICVRLFIRSRPQVGPHQLSISFDERGLTVQRGATRMEHAWSAVRQVRIREPVATMQGSIVIELEYGYVHAWPSKAFDSEDTFRYVAHKVSTLHVESAAAA